MNEVNKTLFTSSVRKSTCQQTRNHLERPDGGKIWNAENFPIHGKSKSKWLTYNMAMRARVFDDWTESMLQQNENALVLHIGCGLDGRCLRVKTPYAHWIDADFADVISLRKQYYAETERYHMAVLDASKPEQIHTLPESKEAIVVLEGLCMYLTNEQVSLMLRTLKEKYAHLHVLMDVYTPFGAKASKYKNPVNDVGVTTLYGVADIETVARDSGLAFAAERSLTPDYLIYELKPAERALFKLMFAGKLYRKIYRLYELS